MKINLDFVSLCGLYCGVCAIYIAHRDNILILYKVTNVKFLSLSFDKFIKKVINLLGLV